tara:strand:- start:185 stop:1216 length:1032 start_codon:yes stop_codon:yes gene_type:complete
MKKNTFSIVIPTWNRRELLLRCVKSIFNYISVDRDFEVIVCDSFSKDGTQEEIDKFKNKIKTEKLSILQLQDNSVCQKRNEGIKKSKNDVIVLLDDDCELISDILEEYDNYIIDSKKYSIFCGQYLTDKSLLKKSNYYKYRDFKNYSFDSSNKKISAEENKLKFFNIVTGNLAFKKNLIFEKDILFDKRILGWGFEDAEWAYRLTQSGFSIYKTNVGVLHNETSGNILNYKKKWYYASKEAYPQIKAYNNEAAKKLPIDFFENEKFLLFNQIVASILKLMVNLSIVRLIDYYLVKTDHLSFFYFPFLYRISIYSSYLEGIRDREKKLISNEDVKKGWYGRGYK